MVSKYFTEMWPHKAKVWSLCLSGNYPYSGVEEDQQTTSYVGHFFLHRYHLSHHYYTQQISLQQVCSYLDQFNKKSILIGIMLSWVARCLTVILVFQYHGELDIWQQVSVIVRKLWFSSATKLQRYQDKIPWILQGKISDIFYQ